MAVLPDDFATSGAIAEDHERFIAEVTELAFDRGSVQSDKLGELGGWPDGSLGAR
jgi:hypothetical protein